MDYKTIYEEAKQFGETRDCAVKAAAIATKTDYAKVHRLFALQGRKNRQGSQQHWTPRVLDQLGYDMEDITALARRCGARTVRTAERVLGGGTFLVRVSGHILCIRDGEVQDWTAGRQHRVKAVYRVVDRNEDEPKVDVAPTVVTPAQPKVKPKLIIPATAQKPSVKHTIHTVANNMWEEAGKPRNVKTLLKLRKMIMDKLENEFDIKRTSASTELGQWQKGIL